VRARLVVATEDAALGARVIATYPLAGVTGGSALLRVGERLLAVHDDAFRATWIALPSMQTTPLVLLHDGAPLRKADKPDFESAVRAPDGRIYLLGSGAAANRCAVARIDPGSGDSSVALRPQMYRYIADALPAGAVPNIEGAVVDEGRLVLFHRGIGTPSTVFELPAAVLYGDDARLLRVRQYALGEIGGIRLGFTDAARIARGRTAFVATAEDTPDAIADGPVTGSVIGLLEDRARAARWTALIGRDGRPFPAKVEGLAIDAGGAWILTDADDPAQPAVLGRVQLDGFH
jgi:hypothetical protein